MTQTDRQHAVDSLPTWVLRRLGELPAAFTGKVELNFHRGTIGSVTVTEKVTASN